MNLVRIISSEFKATVNELIVKFRRYGKSDIRTATQAAPFGIDSRPPKGMVAVFSPTDEKGRSVVVGYVNKNLVADVGEVRLFSVNASGVLQTYVWLKKDGVLLLGGSAKHLARFEELKTGFDQLKTDFNAFLTHVHGGSGTPPAPPATPSTASIDASKTDNVKTA